MNQVQKALASEYIYIGNRIWKITGIAMSVVFGPGTKRLKPSTDEHLERPPWVSEDDMPIHQLREQLMEEIDKSHETITFTCDGSHIPVKFEIGYESSACYHRDPNERGGDRSCMITLHLKAPITVSAMKNAEGNSQEVLNFFSLSDTERRAAYNMKNTVDNPVQQYMLCVAERHFPNSVLMWPEAVARKYNVITGVSIIPSVPNHNHTMQDGGKVVTFEAWGYHDDSELHSTIMSIIARYASDVSSRASTPRGFLYGLISHGRVEETAHFNMPTCE